MAEEWKGEVDKVEMHDHALTPEEIAAKAGVWFGWMSYTGVWSNPDHTIKGAEHLGPVKRKAEEGVTGG